MSLLLWGLALASQPDLSGTWLLHIQAATRARIPVLGDTVAYSENLLIVQLSRDGAGWRMAQTVCDARVVQRGVTLAKTVLPPAFIAAMQPNTVTASLSAEGRFTADLGENHIGYRPGQGLPDSAEHPAVYDWDQDGAPGATVYVDVPLFGQGEVWLVQHGSTILDGTWDRADRISGTLRVPILEQKVIGATSDFLLHGPKIVAAPDLSRFTLTRIEEATNCTDTSFPGE